MATLLCSMRVAAQKTAVVFLVVLIHSLVPSLGIFFNAVIFGVAPDGDQGHSDAGYCI